MNFNILKTPLGKCLGFFIGALVFISCNNQDSANNSTSDTSEVAADTAMTTPTPVAKAKKSGKVSTGTGVDESDTKAPVLCTGTPGLISQVKKIYN